jgi:hypothetical protein
MNLEFVGPASILENGDISYPAMLDGRNLSCSFSYEALQDLDPDGVETNALQLFKSHQLKLLSILEQNILNGHAIDDVVHLFSHDLILD